MSFVRLPYRLWMVALAGVLGAGGFGFSLAFTGSAAALEVPTITTSPLPVPVPTVTAPLPTPTLPPTVPVPTPTFLSHTDRACPDADRSCPDTAGPGTADASGAHADRARADTNGFSARRVGADVAVGARSSYLVARKSFRRFAFRQRGAAWLGRHRPWRRFWLVCGRR